MTDDAAEPSSATRVLEADIRYRRRGQGRPVVLLHPLRMQLEYFNPLCNELEHADLELIPIDLPGHGQSSAPSVAYNACYFTDSVEALLDNLDLRNATIVGESIGGSIALGLAARTATVVRNPLVLDSVSSPSTSRTSRSADRAPRTT
jgi:pimeloyl-ACP methyl ester carboxylesterase